LAHTYIYIYQYLIITIYINLIKKDAFYLVARVCVVLFLYKTECVSQFITCSVIYDDRYPDKVSRGEIKKTHAFS